MLLDKVSSLLNLTLTKLGVVTLYCSCQIEYTNQNNPSERQKYFQMDENNSIIYGLESQARSLTPQLAEPKEIRFFIATQTLKPNNQLHLVELNESSSSLSAKVFTCLQSFADCT